MSYSIGDKEKHPEEVSINELTSISTGGAMRTDLHRGLSARHIQIIALAGSIGTGLFVGSGAALSTCGPGGLLIGYMILSIFLWLLMNMMSEMVLFIPVSGKCTMNALVERYTGNKTLAFTAGMNLYYAQALIAPAEISAASFVIQYWTDVNVAAWISIFWVSLVALNFLAVQFYGEVEFWIGSIKIITAIGLIILGVVLFFGGGPNQHEVLGFHYWKDPGAFTEHLTGGDTGKFLACWTAIVKSAFAFILAPELVVSTAAECKHPRINFKKATERFVYRLIFFYFFGPLVIGVIVAYNDDRLMSAVSSGASGAAASPFVLGIQNAGIPVLNHIVNAAILTSAYSCGNGFIYCASRTLQSMSLNGDAPRIFAKTNAMGVPYFSVGLTSAISLLAFLTVSNSSSVVFTWLSNISTVSGFISWVFVGLTYLRFRKAIDFHNLNDRIPYRSRFSKPGAYVAVFFFTLIAFTNGYGVFFDFDVSDFFAAYVTLPIVFILYVGHMFWFKNFKLFTPPEEIDCFTGLEEVEKEEADYVFPVPKNLLDKFWFWLF